MRRPWPTGVCWAKKKEDVSEVGASNGKMAGKDDSKRYRRYNSLPNIEALYNNLPGRTANNPRSITY